MGGGDRRRGQRAAGDPPPLVDFESRPPVQISSDSQIIRYTSIGVGVVMILLVVLWWRTHVAQQPAVEAESDDALIERIPEGPLATYDPDRTEFDLVLEANEIAGPVTPDDIVTDATDSTAAEAPIESASDAAPVDAIHHPSQRSGRCVTRCAASRGAGRRRVRFPDSPRAYAPWRAEESESDAVRQHRRP